MTILKLKQAIQELENEHGNIDNVTLNYRFCQDSDIEPLKFIYEDLYKEDNSTLDSVVLTHKEQ